MVVKFEHYGTMPIEINLRSIFDRVCAGQIATNGDYYCVHVDHKTHQCYALSKENEYKAILMGRTLVEGESDTFNRENVRGMTFDEECEHMEGRLLKLTDIWGNVCIDEVKNDEYTKWFLENCI